MRREEVMDDMVSEIPEILGIVSKRQLFYVGVGVFAVYKYVPFVFGLFPHWLTSAIACLISAVPVMLVVVQLGFRKKEDKHMFYDRYYLTKLLAPTQKGNWRKVD